MSIKTRLATLEQARPKGEQRIVIIDPSAPAGALDRWKAVPVLAGHKSHPRLATVQEAEAAFPGENLLLIIVNRVAKG